MSQIRAVAISRFWNTLWPEGRELKVWSLCAWPHLERSVWESGCLSKAARRARWPEFGHRPARPLFSAPHIAGKGGRGALSSGCSADLPHLPASPYIRLQGTLLQPVQPRQQVVGQALVCGGRCLAHPFPCWCHPACDLQVEHRVPLAVEQLSHGSW